MRLKHIGILTAIIIATGCTAKKEEANLPAAPSQQQKDATQETLVSVDGVVLTRSRAEFEADQRLAMIRDQIPSDRIDAFRARMLDNVVSQFITRTLLLNEANKNDITANEEEQLEAIEAISQNLPEGMTFAEFASQNPFGEEWLQNEINVDIKIKKLLDLKIPTDITVSPVEIAEFATNNPQRVSMPEKAGARHILIAFSPDDDDATKTNKLQQAEQIRQQIIDGADFAELAMANSDCPSKNRGGDLGTFGRGQMVPEFEDAAFSQDIGAIGPIVETQFGYHILQVTDRIPAHNITDDEIREIVTETKINESRRAYLEGLRQAAEIIRSM